MNRRGRGECVQALTQGSDGCRVCDIGMGQQQFVGPGDLRKRFRKTLEVIPGGQRRYRGDQALIVITRSEPALVEQGVENRLGTGDTAGFDEHALERFGLFGVISQAQIFQHRRQRAAHLATQTAAGQRGQRDVVSVQQGLVDGRFTEFIDNHRRVRRFGQQPVQQRGFAAAEKAAEYGDRDSGYGFTGGHHALWAPADE